MGALQVLMSHSIVTAGGGNIAYRAGTTATLASSSITLTKPTGVVSGDVMYAMIFQDAAPLVSLAGWTQLATGNTPTNSFPVTLFRRVAGASEGASYTFSGGGTNGQGIMVAFSGVNATPEDATTTSATGTASIAYPSITTANAFSWHLAMAGNFNALAATPGGYTARQSSGTWDTCASKNIATAGAVSGVTSTGGGEWVAFSVAVRSS